MGVVVEVEVRHMGRCDAEAGWGGVRAAAGTKRNVQWVDIREP